MVEIVGADLYGAPIYPDVIDKAGVYLFNIIANHIFTDGNKRTGLDACVIFLDFNGYQFSDAVTNQTLTDFILAIASGELSLEEVQNWLKDNCVTK